MKNLKTILLFACISIGLASCTTEGPPGAQGPAGNANVIPDFYNVASNAWLYDDTTYEWYVSISDPDISSDIAVNGLVEVFLLTNTDTYSALPFTYYPNTTVSESFTYAFSPAVVELDVTSSDLSSSYEPIGNSFKVIAISADARVEAIHKGINLKDYNEVMKLAKSNPASVTIINSTASRVNKTVSQNGVQGAK